MDYLWYSVDSYGDQEPQECSATSSCGGNTNMCCVQILTTGMWSEKTTQMFRCMNKGLIELEESGYLENPNGEESISFTMKCMEAQQGSVFIKTGLLAIGLLSASVVM